MTLLLKTEPHAVTSINSILDYMTNKHRTLANDYRTPNGNYSESCGRIAVDIAKILLAQDKTPYIACIQAG